MPPAPVAKDPSPAWPSATAIGLGDESGDDVNEDTCLIKQICYYKTYNIFKKSICPS